MGKISEEGLAEAIKAYQDCVPLIELAEILDVSRQGLWKAIRRAGVETKKGVATRRNVVCDQCEKTFSVTRSRFKRMGKSRFCSDVCYYISRESSGSRLNRHKQRIARWKVSQVFDLKDQMVVHHKDGDHFNTMLRNFLVFKDNADHVRYHHEKRLIELGKVEGHEVVPVWDGENYRGPEPTESINGKKEDEIIARGREKLERARVEQKIATPKGPVKSNEAMAKFFTPFSKDKQLKKVTK